MDGGFSLLFLGVGQSFINTQFTLSSMARYVRASNGKFGPGGRQLELHRYWKMN